MNDPQETEELLEALRYCVDALWDVAGAQSDDEIIHLSSSFFNVGGLGHEALNKAQEILDKYQKV